MAAIAVLVLAGAAGPGSPDSFGPSWVPMAPRTAVLLLALAAASWLRQARPFSKVVVWFGCGVVIGVALLGVVVWREGVSREMLSHRSVEEGKVSALTALCALLAGAVLLLRLLPGSRGFARRQTEALLAVSLVIVGAGVTSTYLLQLPLDGGGLTGPMALLTAIALVLLGSGFLGDTGPDTWPAVLFARGRAAVDASRSVLGHVALGAVLVLAIGASGYSFLRDEESEARRRAAGDMSTVVDLKGRQIAQWHRERRADAMAIATAPMESELRRFLSDPAGAESRARIVEWLTTLRREYDYADIALIDGNGNVRLDLAASPALDPETFAMSAAALAQNRVLIRDLHWDAAAKRVRLTFLVPVAAPRPEAVLLLEIDASRFLFSDLLDWPTQSATAELLLVRREGPDAVILNEPRHRNAAPLALRFPFDRHGHSASGQAALGRRGAFEGLDYRDEPVFASLQAVPGTPWFLVGKIDRREVYAGYRREVARVALLLAVLLLTVFSGISVLWYRRGLASAERELLLSERLRRMIDSNMIGITTARASGEILEANDYFLNLIGFTRDEIEEGEADWRDITPPEWAEADRRALDELRERGVCAPYEKEFRRRDGTRVPVLLVDAMMPGADASIVAFVLDLSERKRTEAELRALSAQRELALDAARMGWWSYDIQRDRARLDARSRDILGVENDELPIGDYFAIVHEEDAARVREAFGATLASSHPAPQLLAYRIRMPDGGTRWVEVYWIVAFDGESGPRRATHVVGTLQNITERQVAQDALGQQMDELRRWYDATLRRESRILELKCEVNQLLSMAGEPARYASAAESQPRSRKRSG